MPLDTNTGYVRLPVANISMEPPTIPTPQSYSTIQKQFCAALQPWQQPLFSSICKAGSQNTLLSYLWESRMIMIVSDTSVQKTTTVVLHGSLLEPTLFCGKALA